MKVKYRQVMYNGSIAMKYAHHAYKCTLIENNDVEHKMSEISTHENHRRRFLASCTLQFESNLTKIIFQGKHFNYFIVVGGWRHVFEAIHIIVYPYATHVI
jgi:hypothetical protein